MAMFWMNEEGEELRPAIIAYLEHHPLTVADIAVIRAYLKQWVEAPGFFATPGVTALRQSVGAIETRNDINRWLAAADEEGIDPL